MRAILLMLAMLVAVTSIEAQGKKPDPRNDRKAKIRERIEAMRTAMREGRIVRYNVKVKVRLKNGNKILGIVKNGRFIEKHDGLDFVVTDQNAQNAGLRIWYYNGTNSYIFLPHAMIRGYKIGDRMSDAQVKAIEKRLIAAERSRRALAQEMNERRKAANKKAGTTPKKADEKPPSEAQKFGRPLSKDETELMKWLDEYPPAQGWGEKKLRDLQVRRITVGVYPNKKEKRFEDNFDKWIQAYELKQELDSLKGGNAVEKVGSQGNSKSPSGTTQKKPSPVPTPGRNKIPTGQPKPGQGFGGLKGYK